MMLIRVWLCLFLVALLPTIVSARQDKPLKVKRWYHVFRTNAFDEMGERHGRWKSYAGDDKVNLLSNGRFRHGRQVGTWRYYNTDGVMHLKEKYERNSPSIQVWRYHKNGKLAKTGMAKLYQDATIAHYYWEGAWQVFDEQGNYTHTETYVKGKLLKKAEAGTGR